MFNIVKRWGDHTIYKYDLESCNFRTYIESLFETSDLEHLHLAADEVSKENLHDIETSLHKKFYAAIKSDPTFKTLYCKFILAFYKQFFPSEKCILFQSFPSIRIQFHNNIVVPPHADSDSLGNHPLGEKNFLIPITSMYGTNRIFIESQPNARDYTGIDLQHGEVFYFNGNKCVHYNQKNTESTIRISFDFRTILLDDYINYIKSGTIVETNPRDPEKKRVPTKMILGGYYQLYCFDSDFDTMLQWHFQKELLLQSQPNFGEEEAVACYEYLKPGTNFITEFKQTELLEKNICDYTGAKYCCMTTSGNMALVLAFMALDLPVGSEVIVPNYTMIASINAIKLLNLKPVLVDVDKESLTLNLKTIQDAVTSNTSAVLHVSLNNRHSNIQELVQYCKETSIQFVEDAAQSLGCTTKGQHFGTFGEIGCFSLSTPKIISTGQGGFCVTNNSMLAQRMTMIKNFGRKEGGIDVFETFGINMKFTDIQAVIGLEQMKKLPDRVKRMREIYDIYYSKLHTLVKMIPSKDDTWIPWFVDCFTESRDELMIWLKYHNIQTRVTYPEINKTPMYYDEHDFPVSKYISSQGLFLPSHTMLTNEQIDHICKLIRLFFESKAT
jgi:perosamine synthetase